MVNFIDLSFIIIAIAVLGFIVKDAFYYSQRVNIPYELKDESEKLFSNVTLGLFIICFCWMTIATFIIPNPELSDITINPIFDRYYRMMMEGIISPDIFIQSLNNFIIYGSLFSIASTVFVLIIFISLISGLIALFVDNRAIRVTFKGNREPITYRRIIKESENYFYFQFYKKFRKWEAIPKEEVTHISNIVTKSLLDLWLIEHFSDIINNHSWIGDERKRRWIIIILILIPLLIIIPDVNQSVIFRIVLVILLVPIVILVLIHNAISGRVEEY